MLAWIEMTEQALSNATIVNLNPKQLARQLMLLEYALYAAIERRCVSHTPLLLLLVINLSNQQRTDWLLLETQEQGDRSSQYL